MKNDQCNHEFVSYQTLLVHDCPKYNLHYAGDDCKAGWKKIEGKCFKFFEERKTFHAADDACIETGSHLASIQNSAENEFIHILM